MKQNYLAWEEKPENSAHHGLDRDLLKELVKYAVLAPSSHNSQPWNFELAESFIIVRPEFKRALRESDKKNRQLFISLGCAIQNIVTGARYHGFDSEVVYNGSGSETSATVRLKERGELGGDKEDLASYIPQRRTNRNSYLDKVPSQELFNLIKSKVHEPMKIEIVSDPAVKDRIADVVVKAGIAAMDDDNFRNELSEYIKPSNTSSPLGMPGATIGLPFVISLVAPFLVKKVNLAKLEKKKQEALLKKFTPVFAIITTNDDTPETWMDVGQGFQRIALLSTKEKMSIAPLAAAIEIGEFYKDLQDILETDMRPQFFMRLGYAKSTPPHSPRLTAEKCLIK